jgi:hypothetical protein
MTAHHVSPASRFFPDEANNPASHPTPDPNAVLSRTCVSVLNSTGSLKPYFDNFVLLQVGTTFGATLVIRQSTINISSYLITASTTVSDPWLFLDWLGYSTAARSNASL